MAHRGKESRLRAIGGFSLRTRPLGYVTLALRRLARCLQLLEQPHVSIARTARRRLKTVSISRSVKGSTGSRASPTTPIVCLRGARARLLSYSRPSPLLLSLFLTIVAWAHVGDEPCVSQTPPNQLLGCPAPAGLTCRRSVLW